MRRYLPGIVLLAALLLPLSASADETIGGACSGTVAAGELSASGNNVVCVGSVWQYPSYQFGISSALCNTGTQGGIMEWTGTQMQYCTGSAWRSLISGVTTGSQYQMAYYQINGSAVFGDSAITTDANNVLNITSTAITANDPALNIIQIWNSGGTAFTALQMTVTSTASAATSLLANFLVGTTTEFSVDKSGDVMAQGYVNVLSATSSQYEINGANALSFPHGDTTSGGSIGLGPGALANETGGSVAYSNTAIGYETMGSNMTLTTSAIDNVAIGYEAMYFPYSTFTFSGNSNVVISTGYQPSTASGNVAILGGLVLSQCCDITIGPLANEGGNGTIGYSVLIGWGAGWNITSGQYETGIGYSADGAGSGSNITGNGNTGIGLQAILNITGASANNTGIGYNSGENITSGSNNTTLGASVASTVTGGGGGNILIGSTNATKTPLVTTSSAIGIGVGVIAGAGDTGIGYEALHATNTDNNGNTAIGYKALLAVTTGTGNTGVGPVLFGAGGAIGSITTACCDTAVGQSALDADLAGQSTAVGQSALGSTVTFGPNTMFGNIAGGVSAGGVHNIGWDYEAPNLKSSYTVGIGGQSCNAGACNNAVAIGQDTLTASVGSTNNVAFSASFSPALDSITTGSDNVAIGETGALQHITTGIGNVAISNNTLTAATGGTSYDIGIGTSAGTKITTGGNNVVVGWSVASTTLTTGSGNIFIATDSTTDATLATTTSAIVIGTGAKGGSGDISIGAQALKHMATNNAANTAVGYQALTAVTTGAGNVAIGLWALTNLTVGYDNVAIGSNAAAQVTTGYGNVVVGTGNNMSAGVCCNVAVGFDVGYGQAASNNTLINSSDADMSGQYNVAVGSGSVGDNQASVTGGFNTGVGTNAFIGFVGAAANNTGLGVNSGATLTSGTNNTILGYNVASTTLTTAKGNILIGTDNTTKGPLAATTSGVGVGSGAKAGTADTAFGYQALTGTTTNVRNNVAIGYQAFKSVTTGIDNVAIGYQAGFAGTAVTVGTNNTFVGYQAKSGTAAITNSTALGALASVTTSNSIVLGNTSISAIQGQVQSITAISDRRRKKDVKPLDLGLDFVKGLKPVSFRFNDNDETLRFGFIAQDLEQALPPKLQTMVETGKPTGIALVERENNEERTYRVSYGELYASLVKSVQQRQAEIDALKAVHKKQATELNELRQEADALDVQR